MARAQRVRVRVVRVLVDARVDVVHHYGNEDDPENQPGDPDEAELDFLAVKADDVTCPVLVWNHETGLFEPFADSLDRFLGSLEQGD